MLEAIVGILGTALMGVIGWAFTLTSRVAVLESDRAGLRELIDLRVGDILRRLDRIENKLNGN